MPARVPHPSAAAAPASAPRSSKGAHTPARADDSQLDSGDPSRSVSNNPSKRIKTGERDHLSGPGSSSQTDSTDAAPSPVPVVSSPGPALSAYAIKPSTEDHRAYLTELLLLLDANGSFSGPAATTQLQPQPPTPLADANRPFIRVGLDDDMRFRLAKVARTKLNPRPARPHLPTKQELRLLSSLSATLSEAAPAAMEEPLHYELSQQGAFGCVAGAVNTVYRHRDAWADYPGMREVAMLNQKSVTGVTDHIGMAFPKSRPGSAPEAVLLVEIETVFNMADDTIERGIQLAGQKSSIVEGANGMEMYVGPVADGRAGRGRAPAPAPAAGGAAEITGASAAPHGGTGPGPEQTAARTIHFRALGDEAKVPGDHFQLVLIQVSPPSLQPPSPASLHPPSCSWTGLNTVCFTLLTLQVFLKLHRHRCRQALVTNGSMSFVVRLQDWRSMVLSTPIQRDPPYGACTALVALIALLSEEPDESWEGYLNFDEFERLRKLSPEASKRRPTPLRLSSAASPRPGVAPPAPAPVPANTPLGESTGPATATATTPQLDAAPDDSHPASQGTASTIGVALFPTHHFDPKKDLRSSPSADVGERMVIRVPVDAHSLLALQGQAGQLLPAANDEHGRLALSPYHPPGSTPSARPTFVARYGTHLGRGRLYEVFGGSIECIPLVDLPPPQPLPDSHQPTANKQDDHHRGLKRRKRSSGESLQSAYTTHSMGTTKTGLASDSNRMRVDDLLDSAAGAGLDTDDVVLWEVAIKFARVPSTDDTSRAYQLRHHGPYPRSPEPMTAEEIQARVENEVTLYLGPLARLQGHTVPRFVGCWRAQDVDRGGGQGGPAMEGHVVCLEQLGRSAWALGDHEALPWADK